MMKSPVVMIILLAAAILLVELSFRDGKSEKVEEQEKLKAEIRELMKELNKD